MHDLSCETRLTRYTLRGALRDPITMTALTVAGAALSATGTLAMGGAAASAGKAGQQAKYFEAKQEEMAAQESRAVSQRGALESERKGKLLLSSLQARSAAGGGSADDPGVLDLAGDIAQRAKYDSMLDLWRGESKARGLEDTAMGARMTGDALLAEGRAKQTASYLSAAGTLVGGAGSAYRTYNGIPDVRYG